MGSRGKSSSSPIFVVQHPAAALHARKATADDIRMKHRPLLYSAFVLAIGLAGCSSAGAYPKPATVLSSTNAPIVISHGDPERVAVATPIIIPVEVPETLGDPLVAADVVAFLKRLGRPIGEVEEVSETEARFVDLRLTSAIAIPEPRNGGTVEVFPEPVKRPSRTIVDRLLNTVAPAPASEHLVIQGRILLRLSGRLTDDAVAGYTASLRKIAG